MSNSADASKVAAGASNAATAGTLITTIVRMKGLLPDCTDILDELEKTAKAGWNPSPNEFLMQLISMQSKDKSRQDKFNRITLTFMSICMK